MMRQEIPVAAGLGCLAAIPAALVTGHLLLALGLGLLGGGLVILGTVTPARGWGR